MSGLSVVLSSHNACGSWEGWSAPGALRGPRASSGRRPPTRQEGRSPENIGPNSACQSSDSEEHRCKRRCSSWHGRSRADPAHRHGPCAGSARDRESWLRQVEKRRLLQSPSNPRSGEFFGQAPVRTSWPSSRPLVDPRRAPYSFDPQRVACTLGFSSACRRRISSACGQTPGSGVRSCTVAVVAERAHVAQGRGHRRAGRRGCRRMVLASPAQIHDACLREASRKECPIVFIFAAFVARTLPAGLESIGNPTLRQPDAVVLLDLQASCHALDPSRRRRTPPPVAGCRARPSARAPARLLLPPLHPLPAY